MIMEPHVGESIDIEGKIFTFTEAQNAPGILYAEIARKAKVYRVMNNGQAFALKAFRPKYQTIDVIKNTESIAKYQNVQSLFVTNRFVINPQKYPKLVERYRIFAYAVLMPWVEGKSWFNYVTGKVPIDRQQSLRLAHALIDAIFELEQRNLAHCDLSSSNFIFTSDFSHIEFIDIEDMFGEGLIPPKDRSKGTPGYAPAWIKTNGVWEAAADRFSAGVLVSEILGWQFEDVREASAGDAYFAEGEFGNNSKRFHLLSDRLEQIHPGLAMLFKTLWYSQTPADCPTAADWKHLLESVKEPELDVNPSFLKFSVLDYGVKPFTQPQITIAVKNIGAGVLTGRIISNFTWLNVKPSEFSCSEDAVSNHIVTLIQSAPTIRNQKLYAFEKGITIQTAIHTQNISGSYEVIHKREGITDKFVMLSSAIGIFILFAVISLGLLLTRTGQKSPRLFDGLATATATTIHNFIATLGEPHIPTSTQIPLPTATSVFSVTNGTQVDNLSNRLFITNTGGNGGVSVVDTASNSLITTIATGSTAQGITSSPEKHFVYSANTSSNSVSVLDLTKNSLINTIPVGIDPVIPAINGRGDRLYVTNIFSNSISVIDTGSNKVIDTITGVSYPWGIAVSPDDSRIAVTLFSNHTVSIYNSETYTRITNIEVGNNPEGVIYQPDGSKLYVANLSDSSVSVIDTKTNTVIKTIHVGSAPGNNPVQFAFNANETRLYVANDISQSVSEIDVATGNVLRNITVAAGPRDVAVINQYLYITNSGSNSVSVVDINTGKVIKTITGFYGPHSITP